MARWLFREGRTFLITGVVVSVFVVGKIAGSGAMIRQEAYAPHISVGAYLQSLTVMLNELVYSVSFFNATRVGGLLLGLLFIALAAKSKPLLFSWLYFVAGVLPVAFIAPRGLSSYYIPVLGLMGLPCVARRCDFQGMRADGRQTRYQYAVKKRRRVRFPRPFAQSLPDSRSSRRFRTALVLGRA